eukprot:GHVQ01015706.1.p1 GENE.GHVQ01015706.1~~GHVQ01015706.1.p1  ORF type:complete len:782 (+),score=86.32 GHVQ01015706.1:449-2794(+)
MEKSRQVSFTSKGVVSHHTVRLPVPAPIVPSGNSASNGSSFPWIFPTSGLFSSCLSTEVQNGFSSPINPSSPRLATGKSSLEIASQGDLLLPFSSDSLLADTSLPDSESVQSRASLDIEKREISSETLCSSPKFRLLTTEDFCVNLATCDAIRQQYVPLFFEEVQLLAEIQAPVEIQALTEIHTPTEPDSASVTEDFTHAISRITSAEVGKVLQLHIRRLDEYVESEKLFMASKYYNSLEQLITYNLEYWREVLQHLQHLRKDAVDVLSIGAVGEDECLCILRQLGDLQKHIAVRPVDDTRKDLSADEIGTFDILQTKVRMAVQNLNFFQLEHLKQGCFPPESGASVAVADTRNGFSEPQRSSAPVRDTVGNPHSRTGSDCLHVVPPGTPCETAEAAVGVGGNAITSNTVLVMLLRGEHFESLDSSMTPVGALLGDSDGEKPMVPDFLSQDDISPATPSKRGRMGSAAFKNISKRMGSKITTRSASKTPPGGQLHSPVFGRMQSQGPGSGIGKMGSRVLYNLTHHHSQYRKKPKRHQPEDADSWTREKSKFLDLWYKVEKDTSISIKVRGKLSCRLFEVLSILNETDIAHWAPMFKSAVKEKQMSRASQLVRQVFDYPMLGQKESILYCYGIDALAECGCVMIFCQAPEGEKYCLGVPIPPKGKVGRTQAATMCFLLFPVSDGRQTTLELYANFVHGLRFVPMKLIAHVVKKVIKGMFVSIAKLCQNFSQTEYASRVRDNPEFYDWMKDTITEFCSKSCEDGVRQMDTMSLASFDVNEFKE